MGAGNMEFIILLVCLLLAALVDHIITKPVVEKNNSVYGRLVSASQIDTFERDLRMIQSFRIEFDSKECESAVENRPPIVDYRKQFQMWSQNMREYDQLRNRMHTRDKGTVLVFP